jgi:hypothetical protein
MLSRIVRLVPDTLLYLKTKSKFFPKKIFLPQNIIDFIAFMFFGISSILLIYIVQDGIFRFYIVILIIFSGILSSKTLGNAFCRILNRLFDIIYLFLFKLFLILLFPVYKITEGIINLCKKFYYPIQIKKQYRKHKAITANKIREIKQIFS